MGRGRVSAVRAAVHDQDATWLEGCFEVAEENRAGVPGIRLKLVRWGMYTWTGE